MKNKASLVDLIALAVSFSQIRNKSGRGDCFICVSYSSTVKTCYYRAGRLMDMDQQFVSTKLAETFRAYETIQMLPKYEFLSRSEQNPGNYDQKVPART